MSEGKTLGNQLQILSGFPFPSTDFTSERNGEPLIRIRDLQQQNPETYFSGDYDSSFLVSRGDVLVGMDGDFNAVKWQGPQALLNQRVCKITTKDPAVLNQDFLYHSLQPHLNNIHKGTAQTTVKHLSTKDLYGIDAELPPLPEQKKIAEILSGIDKQILSIKSEIQQARKISTAVTKELIGSIQDESLPLSEVAINHDSIRVPIKSEERALRNGPYRYYGASGIIDAIDDFLFDGDYILIGEDGANIIDRNKPLAFKVSGKFWVNNHAHIIQPRESCDINFLTYYLESLDYTGIASGSAQPKITRSALDAIQVPLPPLEVQKKIGSVIESTIGVATTAEKKEKKLIDLKQALSSDLLSGRKRVRI